MMLGMVGWEVVIQAKSAIAVMPDVLATSSNLGASRMGDILCSGETAWQDAQISEATIAPALGSPMSSCARALVAIRAAKEMTLSSIKERMRDHAFVEHYLLLTHCMCAG